ncbi:DUF898 domain-containing protein [Methylobacillus gramineus]|uniref:YjgN family protein n=1 Tax=Methylobacillus gramineus TaxID=755169 RepID=UPI001CFFA302|nr:YjgN family protein [Methylobacillus gramineus]MCB5184601.1 DUF898 domain-containing protein [Methylobacillus gramineus]
MNGENQTPVVFTGKTSEYFGIWIVNLLLSILTLGIYSAWAKVRRKKYFYQHTFIDGVAFDYHASPIAILKGRAIAFALFVLYSVSSNISPAFSGILIIAFIIFLPWIIVRSLVFNARNSSHRGLRFDFTGKAWQAAKLYLFMPLLIIVTFGLIYPFISQRRNQFLMQGHRFGLSQMRAEFKVSGFYVAYLQAFLLSIALIGIGGVATILISQDGLKGLTTNNPSAIVPFILVYVVMLTISSAFLRSRLVNMIWNGTSIDHIGFKSTLRARSLVWLYVSNLLAIVFSLGLLTPWAHVRTVKYHADNMALLGEVDFDHFVGEKKAEIKSTGEEIGEMFDVDLAFG